MWLNLTRLRVDVTSVIVNRRHLVVLVAVLVAGLGYLGVMHLQNAHARAQDKKLAAADAAQSADTLAAQRQTAAVLRTVTMPSSFKAANGTTVPSCHALPYQLCWSTTLQPRQAMSTTIAALRSAGLSLGPVTCTSPPKGGPLQAALSGVWTPCRGDVSLPGHNSISVVAFPTVRQHKASYRGPVSFDGTLMSLQGQSIP